MIVHPDYDNTAPNGPPDGMPLGATDRGKARRSKIMVEDLRLGART